MHLRKRNKLHTKMPEKVETLKNLSTINFAKLLEEFMARDQLTLIIINLFN